MKRAATLPRAMPAKNGAVLSDYLIGVPLRRRAQVYRQLFSLLNSGIPLGLALEHCAQNSSFRLRGRLRTIAKHVQGGGLFSEGMSQYPILFPDWEVNVVLAAEKAGTLPQAMTNIAEALEMEWDLRSRTFVATLSLQATSIVLVWVLCVLANVSRGSLPKVLSQVKYATLEALIVIAAVLCVRQAWRVFGRTRRGAALVATIVRRTPLVGPIWRDMAHIRFVRILGTLWKAGVPPMEALQVAAQTTDDYRFINQIGELQGRLSQGSQLSGIIGATNYLPDEVLYMLQTGETTGDVSQSLDTIADYYDMELQAKVKTLPTKLMLLYYAIIVPIIGVLMLRFYLGQYGDVIKMLK